jgi:4-guanidinobutyraldehyde dehydrogenase/NAD-dependent aldehyde dehydrogenase
MDAKKSRTNCRDHSIQGENDAVIQGNDTEYELAAAVWTSDIGRAHKVARALKAGTVWVN